MTALRNMFRLGLLIGLGIEILGMPAAAQTTPATRAQPPAQGLQKLSGADDKRAEELDKAIDAAMKADRWEEAIARAEELLALRTKVQGPKHFEAVNAEWRLKTLRRVAGMPQLDRVAYRSAQPLDTEAESLLTLGKYTEAATLIEKSREIRTRLLTDLHPETATSVNNLGVVFYLQGKYKDAQRFSEKALEIFRLTLTEDHPDTAGAYSGVALCLNAQGKYAQAQPLFEKALEVHRRMLGDLNLITAILYNNLGISLFSQGKFAQAQPIYEKALEIRRHLVADDNLDIAQSCNNLGMCLLHQGQHAQAQPLLEKSLEIRRHLLSENHPHIAQSYSNLALNLNDQGKYAQAQPLAEKAVEISLRLVTDGDPDTAQFCHNLAYNLHAQGKYVQAGRLYEKALEIRRRLLTDEHPDTAITFGSQATNLGAEGNYAQAQPLYEKALEIHRRLLTDDHPTTATSFDHLARNLRDQGKYMLAQPYFEKGLEIRERLLGDDHHYTADSYNDMASNLNAQGKYLEARERWYRAIKSLDKARLRVAFSGLDRAEVKQSMRPALAAVLARLGQPAEAWQMLEEDMGRGLLDELAVREDQKLAPSVRSRLRELTAELEKLDKLMEVPLKDLEKTERAKRFDELKRQRDLASIALGEFQSKLIKDHGPLAGEVARLDEIQSRLPADTALVAWVDIAPVGPGAADPDGEHWGVVVRSRGNPAWISIAGTGSDGLWTKADTELVGRVRTELRRRPAARQPELHSLIDNLRTQRLGPLAPALTAAVDGLPAARRLVILPSRAMAGLPIEAVLPPNDTRIVSYAPSATVFKYLREQSRPDRHAGLLALGDPVYEALDRSSQPKPLPGHGLLVNVVMPGSNAAAHGLKPGDVLLAYNGQALDKKDDLKVVAEGEKPIGVDVWRDGRSSGRDLAPGKLGVVFDPRPAAEAIAADRAITKVLMAARGGDDDFAPLPGTRYEVEALASIFKADDRPAQILVGTEASEPELERLAASGALRRFAYIHLATHGVIDEAIPQRSAVILTQTDLPDPLSQVLNHKPAFDGRLSVREIQRGWELKAELVTLSACETALGRNAGGEGFVGFTQALLMSGARSVCLSLWKVDDTATALLMQRFYTNLLGRRAGLTAPMPKAEALREAKVWLRTLRRAEALELTAKLSGGLERGKGSKTRLPLDLAGAVPSGGDNDPPYASPHFWAAFVLAGDPD